MKGNDAKAPDLFSNASLLSMLSRSQSSRSSTNRASASSSSQDRSSRKKIEKETPTPSVMSSRRSSPSSGRYRPKELTERISNGPNIYVSDDQKYLSISTLLVTFTNTCHLLVANWRRDWSWCICCCLPSLQCGDRGFRGSEAFSSNSNRRRLSRLNSSELLSAGHFSLYLTFSSASVLVLIPLLLLLS